MQPMPNALKQLLARGGENPFIKRKDKLTDISTPPQSPFSYSSSTIASNQPDSTPTIFASILQNEIRIDDKGKKFIVYKILVKKSFSTTIINSCQQDDSFFIHKRYREFDQFHQRIIKAFPKAKHVLHFPPKKFLINHFSKRFLIQRKEKLNNYLWTIIQQPGLRNSTLVHDFLCTDQFSRTDHRLERLEHTSLNDLDRSGSVYFFQSHRKTSNLSIKRRTSIKARKSSLRRKEIKKRRVIEPLTPTETRSTQNGTLTNRIEVSSNNEKQISIQDFCLLRVIGKGSYGHVILARHKDLGKIYAIKVIGKKQFMKDVKNSTSSKYEIEKINRERNILKSCLNHPFLIQLKFSFETPQQWYLCQNFVNGGELYFHLRNRHKFNVQQCQFYTAEIILAIEFLHARHIIYRDLKPENCLLDEKGHLCLIDFGLAKQLNSWNEITSTFCGTPEYLAPEILLQKTYGKEVDWYCLGVVVYEMLTGLPPFYSPDSSDMYNRILHDSLTFPSDIPTEAQDLIESLMCRDPINRLGYGKHGTDQVKQHPFFASLDWEKLFRKEISPPFLPNVKGSFDLKNIDPAFFNEPIPQSVLSDLMDEDHQSFEQLPETPSFENFTFVSPYLHTDDEEML